jgi:hypothetical protein
VSFGCDLLVAFFYVAAVTTHNHYSFCKYGISPFNSCQRTAYRSSSNSVNGSSLTNAVPGWAEISEEVVKRLASTSAVTCNLSAISNVFHAKAKEQVLSDCYVKVRDLITVKNSTKNTNERNKAIKRPKSDNLSRNNIRCSTGRPSTLLLQKNLTIENCETLRNGTGCYVSNVSEKRCGFQKKFLEYELPNCSLIL